MRRIYTIALREYMEAVRSKVFLINALLVPLLVIGLAVVSGKIQRHAIKGPRPDQNVAVLDQSGECFDVLEQRIAEHNRSNPGRRVLLESCEMGSSEEETIRRYIQEINWHRYDALLVIPKNLFEENEHPVCYARLDNVGDQQLQSDLERTLNGVFVSIRCERKGIDPELVNEVRRWVPLERRSAETAKKQREEEMIAKMLIPFAFMFLMFFGIFGTSQYMLTTLIEEKSSRAIELLLSSVSPFSLMSGKILGLCGVGLTTLAIWAASAAVAVSWANLPVSVPSYLVATFLVYFLLGFVLFSALFAAVGAACESLRDAQTFMLPITLIVIVPMAGWFYFAQNPTSLITTLLSFVPPLTPLLMVMRISARPDLPLWQTVTSVLLLLASVPLFVWLSARVFRVGILMYGKPATVRELWKWMRHG